MNSIQTSQPVPKSKINQGLLKETKPHLKTITYVIYSSIQEIGQEQWDSVWPYSPESYNFYLSQEKSNLEGFEFAYLAIYYGEKPVLIAPLFTADFNLGIALEGVGERLILGIQKIWPRFLVMRTLFCGSPVSLKGVMGIDTTHVADPELLEVFNRAIQEFAFKSRVRMIVLKDFMDTDVRLLKPLRSMGYFVADSLPAMVLPIDFSSMEEYYSKLSYQTRKDLRRKVRQTDALGGVDIKVVNNIDDCADEIIQLYENVYNKSAFHFEHLTKDFFTNFCRYMPEETKIFLYRVNNKLIGFNFCLVQEDALVDKYLGFDYTASRQYNLYFLSFLNNVQWCLENGKKNYFLSQGGFTIKSKLGAGAIPLRGLVKFVNPWITSFIRLINRFLKP